MKTMYKVVTMDEFGLNVTYRKMGLKHQKKHNKKQRICSREHGDTMSGQDFWVEPYEQEPHKEPKKYAC